MTDYVNELRLMAEDIYSGVGSVPEVKTLSGAADEIERLHKIEAAAKNLTAQKGRHNTEQAYRKLEEAMK